MLRVSFRATGTWRMAKTRCLDEYEVAKVAARKASMKLLSKEEMEKLVASLVEKSEQDAKTMETEQMIAEIKAFILSQVGEKIAVNGLGALLIASNEGNLQEVARLQLKMKHTAYLIAEAAEKIMRRMWLG